MLKINPLSTLYVGIDVSSKSNYVCALDFYKNKYINSSFANNQPGAEELAKKILECLKEHPDLNTIVAALESTSVYSIHIANFLSSCEELMHFKPYVFFSRHFSLFSSCAFPIISAVYSCIFGEYQYIVVNSRTLMRR